MSNFFDGDFFRYYAYAVLLAGGTAAGGPAGTAAAASLIGLNEGRRNQNDQIKQQNSLMQQQQKANTDQITSELGLAQQRTNAALTGAQTRPQGQSQASFGAQSILGGLSSVNKGSGNNSNVNNGSAGTF